MYYTYILQSELDSSFYIGYTTDLERRLSAHNSGLSRYTKRKIPWKLVYFESFEQKTEALNNKFNTFTNLQSLHIRLVLVADYFDS